MATFQFALALTLSLALAFIAKRALQARLQPLRLQSQRLLRRTRR